VAPDDRGHELLEHTADVGLRVWAATLDELFAESAAGLIDVMGTAVGPADRRESVDLEARDLGALFVDWLSEVLFLFEARDIVPRAIDVHVERDPWRLRATIEGPSAERFTQSGPAVKAVTYHGLHVDENEARVYLDV
jgi:SHS2 domain-containing protein